MQIMEAKAVRTLPLCFWISVLVISARKTVRKFSRQTDRTTKNKIGIQNDSQANSKKEKG